MERDAVTGVYTAKGDVRIKQGDTQLEADSVRYASTTGEARAEGDVVLQDADGYLYGEQMQVDMDTATGMAQNASGFISAYNFHLSGSAIYKLSEQRYRVENGFFTTCDAEVPAWKFGAREPQCHPGRFCPRKARQVLLKESAGAVCAVCGIPGQNRAQFRVSPAHGRIFQ